MDYFNINNIFFTFHGNQMSYLEFAGNLLAVTRQELKVRLRLVIEYWKKSSYFDYKSVKVIYSEGTDKNIRLVFKKLAIYYSLLWPVQLKTVNTLWKGFRINEKNSFKEFFVFWTAEIFILRTIAFFVNKVLGGNCLDIAVSLLSLINQTQCFEIGFPNAIARSQ